MYRALTAYLLESNAAVPGNQSLTTATNVPLGGLFRAQASAPPAAAPGGRGAGAAAQPQAAAAARGRGQAAPPVTGLTVAGEIFHSFRRTV